MAVLGVVALLVVGAGCGGDSGSSVKLSDACLVAQRHATVDIEDLNLIHAVIVGGRVPALSACKSIAEYLAAGRKWQPGADWGQSALSDIDESCQFALTLMISIEDRPVCVERAQRK